MWPTSEFCWRGAKKTCGWHGCTCTGRRWNWYCVCGVLISVFPCALYFCRRRLPACNGSICWAITISVTEEVHQHYRMSRWHLNILTQVNEALKMTEYSGNKYLRFPHPFPWRCSCCILDAFLEKIKQPLISEMTQETFIMLIPETSAGFTGDKPWLALMVVGLSLFSSRDIWCLGSQTSWKWIGEIHCHFHFTAFIVKGGACCCGKHRFKWKTCLPPHFIIEKKKL